MFVFRWSNAVPGEEVASLRDAVALFVSGPHTALRFVWGYWEDVPLARWADVGLWIEKESHSDGGNGSL